jgi:hypothetical protein
MDTNAGMVEAAARNAQQPQQLPPELQPHPIPTGFAVGQTNIGATTFVVLKLVDATGERVVFLEPQAANALSEQLRIQSSASRSGLVLPT